MAGGSVRFSELLKGVFRRDLLPWLIRSEYRAMRRAEPRAGKLLSKR